jgi:hypothetical protein
MVKAQKSTAPEAVEIETLPNGKTRIILNKDITKTTTTDTDGQAQEVYTYTTTDCTVAGTVALADVTADLDGYWYLCEHGKTKAEAYACAVAELVRQKYTQNDVEAIINNYLSDGTNTSYVEDFFALQEYRRECKEKAKELTSEQ